ncbi:MAG: CbiQ family ECF transporter T component [Sinimarinibacterium sp.]|jgi:hypothetical protein
MHPAVRVLIVLVFASVLPSASLAALALFGLVTCALYLRLAPDSIDRLRIGLARLRWLILAIFVLYVGFTPGEPLIPALPGLSREGLAEGTRRALVLLDLLVLVYLLLALTPVAELVGAIRLLVVPLRPLGVDPQRIGLRIALALEGVGEMDARLRNSVSRSGGWERAAALIDEIETQAGVPGAPVEVRDSGLPRWWEWLIPIILAAVLHRWTP